MQYNQLTVRASEYADTAFNPVLEITYTIGASIPVATVITYGYDPQGQRIKLTNGASTTIYPTKFYNTALSTPTTSKIQIPASMVKHIFAGSQDIATIEGTGATAKVYYNSTDSLNSASIMTDGAGTIAETMDYFPFGAIRIDQKATGSTFNEQRKYIGQEYDTDTGLNYLNARYYNSAIGRFISEDPVFLAIGDNNQIKQITGKSQQEILADPQSLNSYSYAENNPIVKSDPSGKCPICIVGIGALAMYAPQITSFAQSLLTPMGQYGLSQAGQDAKQGNYGWAVFGFVTAGEVPGRNIGNLSKLDHLPITKLVPQKLADLSEITGKTASEILGQVSKNGEAFIDYAHKGNVNIYLQRSKELVTRVTTNPEVTKIISAGTNELKNIVKWTENGRLQPLNESGKLVERVRNIINSIKK